MSGAKTIDYTRPAEAFWCASAKRQMPKGSLRFRRFASLDAAVRFLVADKSEKRFHYTIDTETAHYEGGEIEDLFDRPDFPHLMRYRRLNPHVGSASISFSDRRWWQPTRSRGTPKAPGQ